MAQKLKRFDIIGKYNDEDTRYEFRPDGDCYDADEVDAVLAAKDAENRRLKRALWLLKARYFWILMVYASDLAKVANPSIIHKSNFLENHTPRCMEEYQHEAGLYDKARIKCLEKAEEYK